MNSLSKKDHKIKGNLKFNFEGGDLSSDSGLIILYKFIDAIDLDELIDDNLDFTIKEVKKFKQRILTASAGYHEDTVLKDLKNDPLLTKLLDREHLFSQATMSRYDNDLDEKDLKNFEQLNLELLKRSYEINEPAKVILDIDSTGIKTFGKQEDQAFNGHYKEVGFHPLMLFDGITGDLIKSELRPGNVYTSNGVCDFLEPVLQWFDENFPNIRLIFRGDSGFAIPKLYRLLEDYDVKYAIRLKANKVLHENSIQVKDLSESHLKININKETIIYDHIEYKANSWEKHRNVEIKVERKADRLDFRKTFIVTNMKKTTKAIIDFYAGRGEMENFIKEAKNGFDMKHMSHSNYLTNKNKMAQLVIIYNLNNLMKRLTFPKKERKYTIKTIRNKFFKIASRCTKGAGYFTYKLATSYPYKEIFYEILSNIKAIPAV
jgi:hypothetical protein